MKVSVIVATFRSGAGLDRVVASLDRQTLPTDEFEVIFVDDGSADDAPDDDTVARLRAIAAARPNVTVIESENSGWGSRPRNIGIAAATGEYVTFMDHDDELFPDALRSAYEAGAAVGADFVNPKEITTRGWSWGWDVWVANRTITDRAQMVPKDITPLIPHKLYRREFLNAHNIRFPEGKRAFWEDFYVNVEVFINAKSIAILSTTPFYKWHRDTGSNSSNKLYDDVEEYWAKLVEVARFMEERVTDRGARRWLMVNHYRWWVLDLFGPNMSRRDPQFVAASFPYMKRYLERWLPENSDELLDEANVATSFLMHHSDLEHLVALAHNDLSRSARATATSAEWTPKGLRLRAEATWCDASGEPVLFRRDGDRLLRVLPGDLEEVLPLELRDMKQAFDAAWGSFSLRSKGDRVTWRIATDSSAVLDDREDGLVSVRVSIDATIDPSTAALGSPLASGVWEIGARFGFMGVVAHAGLGYTGAQLPAIIGGRVVVGYPTARGVLAIDVGAGHKLLVTPARLDTAAARVESAGSARELHIPLRGLVSFGTVEAGVSAWFGPDEHAAHFEGSTLVVPIPGRRGSHDWRTVVAGVESKALPPIRVGLLGRVTLGA